MVFDRDTATVVGDGEVAFGVEFDLDEIGMSGYGFVHRVVDDLGKQMVQGAFVGSANIHARSAPDRLETFQNLDRRSIILVTTGRGPGLGRGRARRFRRGRSRLFVCGVFRFWRGCCHRRAICRKKIVGIVHIAVMPDVDCGNESAGVCQNPFFQSTM